MLQEWEAKNTNCRRTGGEIVWERSNTVVGLASCRVSIIEDIQKLTWHGCEQPDTTWKLTLSWAWGRCHVKVLSKKTYYMVTYRSHLKYFANDMELLDISLLNIYKFFFFLFLYAFFTVYIHRNFSEYLLYLHLLYKLWDRCCREEFWVAK